mmetsp:Transcript_129078/g.294566  ORF Transcript_129078/g.294566 Transcript_129078/m.294566 type:complete len:309 (+) Transcript_129078:765-1691(+)
MNQWYLHGQYSDRGLLTIHNLKSRGLVPSVRHSQGHLLHHGDVQEIQGHGSLASQIILGLGHIHPDHCCCRGHVHPHFQKPVQHFSRDLHGVIQGQPAWRRGLNRSRLHNLIADPGGHSDGPLRDPSGNLNMRNLDRQQAFNSSFRDRPKTQYWQPLSLDQELALRIQIQYLAPIPPIAIRPPLQILKRRNRSRVPLRRPQHHILDGIFIPELKVHFLSQVMHCKLELLIPDRVKLRTARSSAENLGPELHHDVWVAGFFGKKVPVHRLQVSGALHSDTQDADRPRQGDIARSKVITEDLPIHIRDHV